MPYLRRTHSVLEALRGKIMSDDRPMITVTDSSAPEGHVNVSMPGQETLTVRNEPKFVADAIHEQNVKYDRG